MRIISVQPAARRGGPSIQHLNFARESIRQGVEHHAIVREDHEMLAEYRETFASVTTFEPINAIIPRTVSPVRLGRFVKLVSRLSADFAAAARRVDADLFWTVNDAFLAGPLAARRANVASLTHFLGMTSYRPRPVGLALMAFHRRYSDGLITCQDLIARDLSALGYPSERIDVVYNGIDAARFAVPEPRSGSAFPLTVGMVANLDRRKGLSLFVEAAAIALREVPETRFLVAGDLKGDEAYLSEVRARIDALGLGDRFRLEGIVPDMPSWFASLDVCCVPSLIEALSVACLEAMAASLPVVATDVGGNHIAVEHEITGLLSRPADAPDLAAKLVRLLSSTAERAAFGEAGRVSAESRFALPRVVDVLNSTFERYASGGHA